MKRATAIIERILNTGGPAARRTAESLVAGLAAAMLNKGDSAESRSVRQSELRDASAAETTCSDKRVLTLSDAMRRCQAPVRELAECLLDGTAPELAGSHVWALFRKEYSDRLNRGKAEDGIPLTLTGSVSEDAAIERAGIERARISDYVRRGWIATGMSLQTKKDFFAAGDEILQGGVVRGDIEPALGGQLSALLRHQADLVRFGRQRDRQHLLRRRHLQVQRQVDLRLDAADIVVRYMAAILAQMRSNAVGAGIRRHARRAQGVWMVAAAGIADGRHVIDIDAKT